VKELIDLISEWLEQKKVGSLTINFFKGGISSIDKRETLKLNK